MCIYTHIRTHVYLHSIYLHQQHVKNAYIHVHRHQLIYIYIYIYTLLSCVLSGSPVAGLKMPSPLVSLLWSSCFSAEKVSEKEKKVYKIYSECINAYVHIHMYILSLYIYIYIYMCMAERMYICIYIYICKYTHTSTFIKKLTNR